MSLVDRMTNVYDRIYPISDRFGVKSHVDFSYKDRLTSVTTVVNPRPRAGNVPVNKLYGFQQSGVEVNDSDLYVTGISRTFSGIVEGAICFINNKAHTILWIDRTQSVTFNLLARPERNR